MTSLSPRRFHLALGALFFGVVVLSFFLFRIAHAQALPGPVVTTTAGVDTALEVWRSDGPLWAGLLVLYVGLRAFVVREQHLLGKGRLLAVLTGGLMVLAAVLAWRFEGAPSAGIWTALLAAVALIQHPTVPSGQGSSSTAAGPLALMLVVAISGVTLTPACHAPAPPTQPVIDCIGGSTPGIVTNILETLNAWNRDVADGGCRMPAVGAGSGTPTEATYDWDCVEASAVAKGLQVGGCALAEFVQQYLAPPAGRAAPSGSESVLARAHLERYRREHAGGAAFKTRHGDL